MKIFSALFFWIILVSTIFLHQSSLSEHRNNQKRKRIFPFEKKLINEFEAEPFCGTDFLHEREISDNPIYQKEIDIFEKKWQEFNVKDAPKTENPPEYILPVVVHIIHENGAENISNNQVFQAIEYLNDAFANVNFYDQNTGEDTQIQFCLAIQDPEKNTSDGINRVQSSLTDLNMSDDVEMKNLSRWDPLSYVNIWVVKEICNSSGNCNVAGYAYLPYTHGSSKDGIVIEHRLFGEQPGKTGALIHEMGHYLGLYHTFQGGCTNADCVVQGDRVCDTPPDQSTAPVPCDGSVNTCDTDTNSGFSSDQNDQFWNYMDYGDLNCFSAFTAGQIERMHFSIENLRSSLLESVGCKEPCPDDIVADFDFSNLDIKLGETVTFLNNSSFASDFEWRINGDFFSSNTNPTYTFDELGTFEITLIATGNGESCISKITKTVKVTCNVDANFQSSNPNPEPDEIVNFSAPFLPNQTYTWSLNGVPSGTNFTYDFTIPNEGIFEICLTVEDGNCKASKCEKLIVFRAQNECISPGFSKSYQLPSGASMEGHCVAVSPNGQIHIAGVTESKLILIDTDFSGNILWANVHEVAEDIKEVAEIIVDISGDIIGCGTTMDNRAFIFKRSPMANSFEWFNTHSVESEAVALIETNGYYYQFLNTPISLDNDLGDYIIIKTEKATGNQVVLTQPIAFSSAADEQISAVTTDGTHFYVATNFSSFSPGSVDYVGVVKMVIDGDIIWSRRTSGDDQKLVDIHYKDDGIYLLGDGLSVGAGDKAIVYKMNLDGVVIWKRDYNQLEESINLISIEDGLLIQGKTQLKTNFLGQQWWHKEYAPSGGDLLKPNQITALAGFSIFITNQSGQIFLHKTNAGGEISESCVIDKSLLQTSTPLVFVAQFFPSKYDYPLNSSPEITISTGNVGLESTTQCFGSCDLTCNSFSINNYGEPASIEVPHCMLPLDESILVAGRKDDQSFIMELDTFGKVLNHWVLNISVSVEYIQNMIRTPNNMIFGYGDDLFNQHGSDFYFQFDYLNGTMDWIRKHNAIGKVTFSDMGIYPASGRIIIVGSHEFNGQKYGLTFGFTSWNGMEDLTHCTHFEAEYLEKCLFTSLYQDSPLSLIAAGGIADSNDKLSNVVVQIPNPSLTSNEGYEYSSSSPNEIIEDYYVDNPEIQMLRLTKSQKANTSKCRHFIKGITLDGSFEKMIDFDIEFEEKKAFELVPIPNLGGFLIAGNGQSGANYLTKISTTGELEWAKKFNVTRPLSFALLGNYVYFSFGKNDQDFIFGRINHLSGVISSDCDFIEDFQPIYEEVSTPVLELHQLNSTGTIAPMSSSLFVPSDPSWAVPSSQVLCETQCFEKCDNQIDDDSDGLIDNFDPDCDCQTEEECKPQTYLRCEDMPCAFSYELEDVETLTSDTLWTHPMSPFGQTPTVGDVDGDCIPDVVMRSETAVGVLESQSGILKYSGQIDSDWGLPFSNSEFVGHTALADVDLDGMAEIFVSIRYDFFNGGNQRTAIIRYDYNSSTNQLETDLNWTIAHSNYSGLRHSPSFADFNGDGRPEVYFGNVIINAQTGQILAQGTENNGDCGYNHNQTGSVAADVLSPTDCQNCFGLELIAGNQVYAVSLYSEAVPAFNSMTVVRELEGESDGYTRIADFDNDGDLDAVVAFRGTFPDNAAGIYIWDIQSEYLIGKTNSSLIESPNISLHSIGDVDGDGWVEIVVPFQGKMVLLEDYQNGGGLSWGENSNTIRATRDIELESSSTAYPLFDINADGALEIFALDLFKFGILDDKLEWVGDSMAWNLTSNQHFISYPVIADITGDGFTEVLVKNHIDLFALKMNVPMPKTRSIWNQFNYFMTNILDDGSVPQNIQENHLLANGELNGFLIQQPILNQDTLPIYNMAEAALDEISAYCFEGGMVVEMEVCNQGNIAIPSGVPITFYEKNPFAPNATILEIVKTDSLIEPNDCVVFLFEIPLYLNQDVHVFFNDNGTSISPLNLTEDFPNSWMPECDFSNNFSDFSLDVEPPNFTLGNDTIICGTGVIELKPGDGFQEYLWQDGSEDSTFTTWLSGLYWVEVKDSCGVVFRDSILIEMLENEPVSNNSDTTICLSEGVQLSAFSDFKSIQWYPNALFDCDTCFSNLVFPDTTTQVILIGKTDAECVSVDTILIEVIELEIDFVTTKSCDGEPNGTALVNIRNALEPIDYQWDVTGENSNSITNLSPGEYFLTVVDAQGCEAISSVIIEQTNTESIDFDIQDVSCFGEEDGAINLKTSDETLLFSLDGNDFEKTGNYQNLEAGVYSLFVLDSNNCVTGTEFVIDQPDNLTLTLPDDLTLELGDTYQIIPQTTASQNANFNWVETAFLNCSDCLNPIVQPLETATYQLQITDTTGCQIQDEITIFVQNSKRIYIPNTFSPNGDGLNDRFHPYGGSEIAQIRQFKIFDRWGNLVFQNENFPPNEASFGWDGKVNNQETNAAVYVFFVEVEYLNGEVEIRKGDLILMK